MPILSSNDIDDLVMAICATAEAMGTTLSENAAAMMATDLSVYPMEDIANALVACRREHHGRLTLAAIMERVKGYDGRPGKDEAWSIGLSSFDEHETVVLTEEIQGALEAARPVLDIGDKIGARMAFMSAYERLVEDARRDARPANWHVSLGFDQSRRLDAVSKAVQLKRISVDRGQKYLADMSETPLTEDGRAIAGLLTGKPSKPSSDVKAKLDEIRKMLGATKKQKDEEAAKARAEVLAQINEKGE